jgi:hypothetical protein
MVIRGEIDAFEKPMFRRDYRVLLKTPDRDMRVICNLLAPEQFSAVYTLNHGSELVGTLGETRVPMARVGELVLVHGVCKGVHDGAVVITASVFARAK